MSDLEEDEIFEISGIQEIIRECPSFICENFEKLWDKINKKLQELERHAMALGPTTFYCSTKA